MIENVQTGTNCRILYDFAATSDSMLNVKTDDTVTLLSDCLIIDTWAYVKCGKQIISFISQYTLSSFYTGPAFLSREFLLLDVTRQRQSITSLVACSFSVKVALEISARIITTLKLFVTFSGRRLTYKEFTLLPSNSPHSAQNVE